MATATDLLQRRRQMMAKRGGEIINLLDYADQPHGNYANPTQYVVAFYPINDTIAQGESMYFKVEFDFIDEHKTQVYVYNSTARAAGLLAQLPIVNGVAEGSFSWKVYDTNNQLRLFVAPNNSSHQISTVKLAQLYRL